MYSLTKIINKNKFKVLIEDEESFINFDEILTICQFPYELNTIDDIYEITIDNKYHELIKNLLKVSETINVLQIN